MEHILAIEATEFLDPEDNVTKVSQMIVSQEVIDWLDQHDIEYTEARDKVYICNHIRYRYVGLHIVPDIIPMTIQGEA